MVGAGIEIKVVEIRIVEIKVGRCFPLKKHEAKA